eukprot:754279-Rhodomonas_salina.1
MRATASWKHASSLRHARQQRGATAEPLVVLLHPRLELVARPLAPQVSVNLPLEGVEHGEAEGFALAADLLQGLPAEVAVDASRYDRHCLSAARHSRIRLADDFEARPRGHEDLDVCAAVDHAHLDPEHQRAAPLAVRLRYVHVGGGTHAGEVNAALGAERVFGPEALRQLEPLHTTKHFPPLGDGGDLHELGETTDQGVKGVDVGVTAEVLEEVSGQQRA